VARDFLAAGCGAGSPRAGRPVRAGGLPSGSPPPGRLLARQSARTDSRCSSYGTGVDLARVVAVGRLKPSQESLRRCLADRARRLAPWGPEGAWGGAEILGEGTVRVSGLSSWRASGDPYPRGRVVICLSLGRGRRRCRRADGRDLRRPLPSEEEGTAEPELFQRTAQLRAPGMRAPVRGGGRRRCGGGALRGSADRSLNYRAPCPG
jgi:hypothetical protein